MSEANNGEKEPRREDCIVVTHRADQLAPSLPAH